MKDAHLRSPASLCLADREEVVSLLAAVVLALLDAIGGEMDKVTVLVVLLVDGWTGCVGVG
jgi:hypothetical protein